MGTGKIRRVFTDTAIRKVSDGDFNAKMENVNFKGTPREEITVGDMINHMERTEFFEQLGKKDIKGVRPSVGVFEEVGTKW